MNLKPIYKLAGPTKDTQELSRMRNRAGTSACIAYYIAVVFFNGPGTVY